MFVRKKPNTTGSTSIQIIDKSSGKYKVVKTVGSSSDPEQIEHLFRKAHSLIPSLVGQSTLDFISENDKFLLNFFKNSHSLKVRVTGPEKIFGKLFDEIGFGEINDELFRDLVITRLVYPGSKLKTIDYLLRYRGKEIQIDKIYRFLDKLNKKYKHQVEQISFAYTRKILKEKISIVFYDMTTIYFEASDEDDLRKKGFSKDGKHQNPQIYLGLLVGLNGYPIGYEIFEGDIYEGHTLIPVLENFEQKFTISKPMIVADAGLLSGDNIKLLEKSGYKYILGARIKNEKQSIKEQILQLQLSDGQNTEIQKDKNTRLIISYTTSRAKKDEYNRIRGIKRLEKNLKSGKLTKSQINNRGYNKYLKLSGKITIEINYDKFIEDGKWDGLKGYLTNSNLPANKIIANYNNLWEIEKAFRISKTDLKIRPIYHRLQNRIEAHICVSFVAYTIYKELERILSKYKAQFSARRAIELTQTMYSLDFELPESQRKETIEINISDDQKTLCKILQY
jgi:transposase